MAKPQRRKTLKRSAGRVGYGLPTVLAVALHLGILVISVIKWPSSEPEAPNNAIVQATLISTETRTDQAQQAAEARTRAAERQAQEAYLVHVLHFRSASSEHNWCNSFLACSLRYRCRRDEASCRVRGRVRGSNTETTWSWTWWTWWGQFERRSFGVSTCS